MENIKLLIIVFVALLSVSCSEKGPDTWTACIWEGSSEADNMGYFARGLYESKLACMDAADTEIKKILEEHQDIAARSVHVDANALVLSETAVEYACGQNCIHGECEHIYKIHR